MSTVLVKIDAVMARIPTFTCKPGCSQCCGPVMMSAAEQERILDRRGFEWPMVKPGTLDCGLLTEDGKCSVYDIRPAVCRLFGASKDPQLACPEGCAPERPLSIPDTAVIFKRVMRIGARKDA